MERLKHHVIFILLFVTSFLVLQFLSFKNFRLFHSITEIFTILLAFSIFLVAWNTRRFFDNSFFSFLGVAFLFSGFFKLAHFLTLDDSGTIRILPGDVSLQFWIASRCIECTGLLVSILLINSKLKMYPMFLGLTFFAISISYGILQVELFSISHAHIYQSINILQFEILFILIQVFAAWKLYGSRKYLHPSVTHLLIISLIFSSFTDLSFILNEKNYGADAVAHIMELFSYYVIYRVFVTTNLSKPFDSVFRNLKLHEKELKCSRDELEHRVFERTKELGIINNNLQSEIEERKKKETALQESEERFRVVLKNSKITVAHCDLNLRYTWIHSPVLDPYPRQTIGLTDIEISPMRGFCDLMRLKKSVLSSRTGKRSEIIFDFTDKKVINDVTAEPLFNDHGDLIGVTTASVDITDRREVEEALKIRHSALESIYQIMTGEGRLSDSIYHKICENIAGILDISYVLIGSIQDSAINILSQYSKSERNRHIENFTMQNCPCGNIFVEKNLVKIDGVLDNLFPNCSCFSHQDIHSYIGVPVFNENRNVIGVICVLDDKKREYSQEELHIVEIFSRYISYEFERETFQRELLQSREMKILGQLTSGVAHEVRNPLNAIWAITEALFRELEGQEQNISVYTEHIKSQVERLTRLMQDLLDFGKPFNLKGCSRISLTTFLSGVIDFWNQTNSSSEHPIQFIKLEEGEDDHIKADVNKLQQMMINILDNAAQHSPSGSPITIEMRRLNQSTFSITVTDKGCGIPPENLDQLFEPFFTTRKKGIGLGLCIVKHIIETHHGSIKIRNNSPLPGATVEIRLPICSDPAETFDDKKDKESFTKHEKITV